MECMYKTVTRDGAQYFKTIQRGLLCFGGCGWSGLGIGERQIVVFTFIIIKSVRVFDVPPKSVSASVILL